ncbi:hypothetical protein ACYULU_09180 [Breznakiellaceae bacterium SP9]
MTTITVKVGQKPTEAQVKEIRAAAKEPINYTPDCPPSTPEALKEFASQAAEIRRNQRKAQAAVSLRVFP